MPANDIHPNRRSGMMRLPGAQPLFAARLKASDIAITRLACQDDAHGLTAEYELEDSFLLTVQLNDFRFGLWRDGRPTPSCGFGPGTIGIYEMDRRWIANIHTAFDVVHFHVPRAALDRVAGDLDAKRVATLLCPAYDGTHDPVLHGLATALLPGFERPEQTNTLFVDHVRLAVGAHVAQRYGGLRSEPFAVRGGLAPWQLRRAIDLLLDHLGGDITTADLARECGVSTGHFVRAFRTSVGTSPHRWLMERRVERVKQLLLGGTPPIAEVATACGFADQSHLTRVFTKAVGITPGAWRRARRN